MVLTTLTVGTIGLLLVIEYILPYWPITPWKRNERKTPSDYGLAYETLTIEVETGLQLRGYLIPSLQRAAQATVIQLHGIGSCKEIQLPFASFLARNGFNVLVFDQRAHGKSDGQYCTFGENEKKDVSKIIDFLTARYPHLPIGIHGASLGGAVALQALAIDKRLKFGIVESTFNTLENVVVEYGRDYFKFRSKWLARRILSKAAAIAKFNPFNIKPVEACKDIEQPMLLAHGDMDDKIPIAFNWDNFNALKTSEKEFYIIKGANHYNVGEKGGTAYQKKIISFLKKVSANFKKGRMRQKKTRSIKMPRASKNESYNF